jgi:hypothetical protein
MRDSRVYSYVRLNQSRSMNHCKMLISMLFQQMATTQAAIGQRQSRTYRKTPAVDL